MKKKNIINLIRYHSEGNEAGFRSEAYEIAKEFDQVGDYQLAEYIMALLSNANTFVPQVSDLSSGFFEKSMLLVEILELTNSCSRVLLVQEKPKRLSKLHGY